MCCQVAVNVYVLPASTISRFSFVLTVQRPMNGNGSEGQQRIAAVQMETKFRHAAFSPRRPSSQSLTGNKQAVTYGEVNSPRVSQKWNLPLRSVFNQIASMEPEIDCNVPSMSR